LLLLNVSYRPESSYRIRTNFSATYIGFRPTTVIAKKCIRALYYFLRFLPARSFFCSDMVLVVALKTDMDGSARPLQPRASIWA